MMTRETRRQASDATIDVVEAFHAAVNRHDVDGALALMTDDIVFETTLPPPDGERFEGHARVREFWERFFTAASEQHFQAEETVTCADRCTVRWRYTWTGQHGERGHVRGIDLFRVRDGKIAEKLSYVKG